MHTRYEDYTLSDFSVEILRRRVPEKKRNDVITIFKDAACMPKGKDWYTFDVTKPKYIIKLLRDLRASGELFLISGRMAFQNKNMSFEVIEPDLYRAICITWLLVNDG